MTVDLHVSDGKKESRHGPATAVALEAGKNPDSLPKIIASGRGVLAEQILRLAFENDIKVREDADLAELLAKLDLDHEIPPEAVVAVAEILARVFEANVAMTKNEPREGHA
jgi:flagellar biosynthesis protein